MANLIIIPSRTSRTTGLEFITEDNLAFEADDDFAMLDDENLPDADQEVAGRLYLAMPNDGALADILRLYRTWRRGRPLDHGFTPWRDLFRCLKTMRPRGPRDRIPEDAVAVWRAEIAEADIREVRVEAELFFRQTAADRGAALARLEHAVAELDGEVVTSAQIPAIAYHDLSNYSGKDLSRLHLRLAAIPCDKDVWACPDLRSGRVLSRGKSCRATERPAASRHIRVTPRFCNPIPRVKLQPLFLLFRSFPLFDRAAGFPSSRPQDAEAGARRACQGWPLFSGHP